MNKIMKKNIKRHYKISLEQNFNGWVTIFEHVVVLVDSEEKFELLCETEKKLELNKNYCINDQRFTVVDQTFDLDNDSYIYYTDIEEIDENLEERHELECELFKSKYKKAQEKINNLKSEMKELKEKLNKKVVVVPEKKKGFFSLF